MRGGSGPPAASRRHHAAAVVGTVFVVGYLVLALLAIGFGLLLTNVLLDGGLGRWDTETTEWFEDEREPLVDDITWVTSNMAATLTVVGLAALVVSILAVRKRWKEVTFLTVALVLEVMVFLTATLLISRARPNVEHLDPTPPTDSYPSGHTAAAVALYAGLAVIAARFVRSRPWRRVLGIIGVFIPVVVAVSRVYRGMHHPTDVFSGLVLGAASITVGVIAVRAAWPEAEADLVPGRVDEADKPVAPVRDVAATVHQ